MLADLARWTGEERADEAARSRMRERWLRRQAEEDARFAGVLLDLSEAGAGVAVRTTGGRTVHGQVVAVAKDFCVVRHAGMATLLAFSAVATVRPEPGSRAGDAASGRAAPVAATLVEVLAGLAGDRPRVRVVLDGGGGDAVAGELRSVGADVVTLRLDGGADSPLYLPLAAVRELTLLG